MERLNCFMCRELVAGGLDGLSQHLIGAHGLTINRGLGNIGFECGQYGCRSRFVNFFDLRKHIRNYHLVEADNEPEEDPLNIFQPPYDESSNDDVDMVYDGTGNAFENPILTDNVDLDFRSFIMGMVARFQCNGSMTGQTLTQVLDECEEFLLQTCNFLKTKVEKVLQEKEVLNDVGLTDVLKVFEFDSPFRGLRTFDQHIEALKQNCNYIDPVEIPLGYRVDDELDNRTGMYIPKMRMETCQYIPVIETLKLVLSSKNIREAVISPQKNPNGVLGCFLDSQHAKTHPFFMRFKQAIRIQLYYNELEIVNPLGSKTGVHKLGAFYYTLENLPYYMNSELTSIRVLRLAPEIFFMHKSIDGETFLELISDDLIQMKIKMGPRKILLKLIKEAKGKATVLLGNYEIEGDGRLQRIDLQYPESASTSKEQHCTVASSSNFQLMQPESTQSVITAKPSADNFSSYGTVREVLINHAQGKRVLKAAQTAFTEEDRRALIRILVSELVKVHNSHYPPEQAKLALAMAIVKEFPLLKNDKSANGHEHYYDSLSKKGFIEYRLWTMRKNLSPFKKKYNTTNSKKKGTDAKRSLFYTDKLKLLSKEELDEKISWMKCTNPTASNKAAITSCLEETLPNRRDWMNKKNPSISDVFKTYPRLLDYKGEMIDIEFEHMFGGAANNFLARFPSYYSPRILAYSESHRPELYEVTSHMNNEHLRALVILVQLLPVTNAQRKRKETSSKNAEGKRKKKQVAKGTEIIEPDEVDFSYGSKSAEIPNKFLIRTVREDENLPQFVQNIRTEYGTNIQPYIICVRGQRNDTYIVQGDGWFIDIHETTNPIVAFDSLFKCYNVLNLSYPVSLQNFYNFMESYVYKIGSQTPSIVSSVHINIANTKLETCK